MKLDPLQYKSLRSFIINEITKHESLFIALQAFTSSWIPLDFYLLLSTLMIFFFRLFSPDALPLAREDSVNLEESGLNVENVLISEDGLEVIFLDIQGNNAEQQTCLDLFEELPSLTSFSKFWEEFYSDLRWLKPFENAWINLWSWIIYLQRPTIFCGSYKTPHSECIRHCSHRNFAVFHQSLGPFPWSQNGQSFPPLREHVRLKQRRSVRLLFGSPFDGWKWLNLICLKDELLSQRKQYYISCMNGPFPANVHILFPPTLQVYETFPLEVDDITKSLGFNQLM